MSKFQSEILPSGAELQISNEIYCISTTEHYVQVTKADIARMYGIVFPEKRRTGECYNTTASTEVDDINVADLTQPSDKYKQRVQQIAEQMARVSNLTSYQLYIKYSTTHDGTWSADFYVKNWPLIVNRYLEYARIAVASQAEAIREFDKSLPAWVANIQIYLIENGYVPAPECEHVNSSWNSEYMTRVCDNCGHKLPEDPGGKYAMGPGH